MKLADAVAVYEGRERPSLSLANLSLCDWARARLEQIVRTTPAPEDDQLYRFTGEVATQLDAELEAHAPLNASVRRLSGSVRPTRLHWACYINTDSGDMSTMWESTRIMIAGSPSGARRVRRAAHARQHGSDTFTDAHRQLLAQHGLTDVEGLVLLSCELLNRYGARRRRLDQSERVNSQYAGLINELRNGPLAVMDR